MDKKIMGIRVTEDTHEKIREISNKTDYSIGKLLSLWASHTKIENGEFTTTISSGGYGSKQ